MPPTTTPTKDLSKIESRETVKLLDCKLTQDEILKYGKELAQVTQGIDSEESRKKSVVKELDAGIATLEAQRSSIASKVARGFEMRDVKVTVVKDYKTRLYHEERHDTGEIINERPLRDDERQPTLPGAGNGK